MPVMDGYTATRHIRKLRRGAALPIIAMTANGRNEDIAKSKEAGMDAHVVKPIDINSFYEVLATWLPQSEEPSKKSMAPKPPSSRKQNFSLLTCLNWKTALQRTDNDSEMYNKQLSLFVTSHGDFFSEYSRAFHDGDQNTYVRLAHTLKSNADLIGAEQLARLAAELEQVSREEQGSPRNLQKARAIQEELREVLGCIKAYQQEHAEEETGMTPEDPNAVLQTMIDLLENSDAEVLDIWDTYKTYLLKQYPKLPHKVDEYITSFSFSEALECFQTIYSGDTP